MNHGEKLHKAEVKGVSAQDKRRDSKEAERARDRRSRTTVDLRGDHTPPRGDAFWRCGALQARVAARWRGDGGRGFVEPELASSTPAQVHGEIQSEISLEEWIKRRSQAQRRVCLIEYKDPDGSSPIGTGFLVARDLVMTNWHVIKFLLGDRAADPTRLQLRFDYTEPDALGRKCRLAPRWLVACDPGPDAARVKGDDLDYALLRLAEAPGDDVIGGAARGALDLLDRPIELRLDDPLCVVQHPDGEPVMVTVSVKGLKELKSQTRMTHRVNTEACSSGSPVFNRDFRLVALHRGWALSDLANEAIPIDAIRAQLPSAVRDELRSSPALKRRARWR